jgi:hypothetical protein
MRPYYEQDGVTIYHGDCREILPRIEAHSLVTDPPYGVGLGVDKDERGGTHGLAKPRYKSYEDTHDNFLGVIVPAIGLALSRVQRGAVFSGPHVHDLPRPSVFGGVYCPAGSGRHQWGFNTFLPVLFYGIGPELHRGGKRTTIRSSAVAEHNGHPCPKPLPWMAWLVSECSLPSETVLDPFMGSGTTLRAAKDLGRNAIGIEIEESYCEIAARRLSQTVLDLGGVA